MLSSTPPSEWVLKDEDLRCPLVFLNVAKTPSLPPGLVVRLHRIAAKGQFSSSSKPNPGEVYQLFYLESFTWLDACLSLPSFTQLRKHQMIQSLVKHDWFLAVPSPAAGDDLVLINELSAQNADTVERLIRSVNEVSWVNGYVFGTFLSCLLDSIYAPLRIIEAPVLRALYLIGSPFAEVMAAMNGFYKGHWLQSSKGLTGVRLSSTGRLLDLYGPSSLKVLVALAPTFQGSSNELLAAVVDSFS
jgi:hypothetical protein